VILKQKPAILKRQERDKHAERQTDRQRETERWENKRTSNSNVEVAKLCAWCVDCERGLLSTLQTAETISTSCHSVRIVYHYREWVAYQTRYASETSAVFLYSSNII